MSTPNRSASSARGIAHRRVVRDQQQRPTRGDPIVHGLAFIRRERRTHRTRIAHVVCTERVRDHQQVVVRERVGGERDRVRREHAAVVRDQARERQVAPGGGVEVVVRFVEQHAQRLAPRTPGARRGCRTSCRAPVARRREWRATARRGRTGWQHSCRISDRGAREQAQRTRWPACGASLAVRARRRSREAAEPPIPHGCCVRLDARASGCHVPDRNECEPVSILAARGCDVAGHGRREPMERVPRCRQPRRTHESARARRAVRGRLLRRQARWLDAGSAGRLVGGTACCAPTCRTERQLRSFLYAGSAELDRRRGGSRRVRHARRGQGRGGARAGRRPRHRRGPARPRLPGRRRVPWRLAARQGADAQRERHVASPARRGPRQITTACT